MDSKAGKEYLFRFRWIILLVICGIVLNILALKSGLRTRSMIRDFRRFSLLLEKSNYKMSAMIPVDARKVSEDIRVFFKENGESEYDMRRQARSIQVSVRSGEADLFYRFLCLIEKYGPGADIETLDYSKDRQEFSADIIVLKKE